MCVHVHVSVAYSCRWLAYTLVCVNVALTVRASVCHILEVINQARDQATAEITPRSEKQTDKILCRICKHLHMVTHMPRVQERGSGKFKRRTKYFCLNTQTCRVFIVITLWWKQQVTARVFQVWRLETSDFSDFKSSADNYGHIHLCMKTSIWDKLEKRNTQT